MAGMTLDRAVDRLLHARSARERFLAGEVAHLDLADGDADALGTIDRHYLRLTADRIVRELLSRKYRGSGGISTVFERTLAAWRAARPDDPEALDLVARFMESDEFGAWRELPYAGGPGLALEDAFRRFVEREPWADGRVVQEEFLAGMTKVLLVNARPSFVLPPEFRACPGGFFAVDRRGDEPVLYAAVRGKFVRGAITPAVADVLEGRAEATGAVRERLVGLGLL
jgi:hypothetical protein